MPDTNKEIPEPFNATQSFKELSKQVGKPKDTFKRVDERAMMRLLSQNKSINQNQTSTSSEQQPEVTAMNSKPSTNSKKSPPPKVDFRT